MNYTALLLLITLVFSVNAMEMKPLDSAWTMKKRYENSIIESAREDSITCSENGWIITAQTLRKKCDGTVLETITVSKFVPTNVFEITSKIHEPSDEKFYIPEDPKIVARLKQNVETFLMKHISTTDAYGNTPLHHAAATDDLALVSTLLDHGANTRTFNGLREIPLHIAVNNQHTSCTKLLVSRDPESINVAGRGGNTALHIAALPFPYEPLLQLLLDKGASITQKNKAGETPVDILKKTGRDKLATFMIEYAAQNSTIA